MIDSAAAKATAQRGYEEMLSAIRSTPDQLQRGLRLGEDRARALLNGRRGLEASRVIICGVGGSAFPAELLKLMLGARGRLCEISRAYLPPAHPGQLVISCSFSGNTEEAICSFLTAIERGSEVIAISAGGELERLAHEHHRPHIKLTRPTPNFQPRAATGLLLGALIGLLDTLGLCEGGGAELSAASVALERLLSDLSLAEQGARLASRLSSRIPVFYALTPYGAPLAQLAKIKLNENAKRPAFWGELPEMNHNELIGYSSQGAQLLPVFFTDPSAPKRLQTRLQRTIESLRALGVEVIELPLVPCDELIAQLLATLYVVDVASCTLALEAGLNPNEVELLERFKQSLGPFQGLDP